MFCIAGVQLPRLENIVAATGGAPAAPPSTSAFRKKRKKRREHTKNTNMELWPRALFSFGVDDSLDILVDRQTSYATNATTKIGSEL